MSEATSGRGSAGNVIAALCSLFVPGLGQLVQGRVLWALFWFVFAGLAWTITFVLTFGILPFGGALVNLFACIHAAVYTPRR
jgi:TM2 domain-containing membrane protein YozV